MERALVGSALRSDASARRADACLTPRDRRILSLASRKLVDIGGRDFREALRALREAVEESIPAGRLYVLSRSNEPLVVGSILSGVGIVEVEGRVMISTGVPGEPGRHNYVGSAPRTTPAEIARVHAHGRRVLGPLLP